MLLSCSQKNPSQNTDNIIVSKTTIFKTTFPEYTSSFNIKYFKNYKKLEVRNPWDSSTIIARYYLLAEGCKETDFSEPGNVIYVPIKNMACLSATQIAMASSLGVLETITGITETSFIRNKTIREKIKNSEITDLGTENIIDQEKLINLQADIVMISPYRDNKFSRLSELGQVLGFDASYLEASPLGRSEWIKFFSYFFNKEKLADEIFNEIKSNYLQLKQGIHNKSFVPKVLSGKRFGGLWHVPAGNSYMGNFYKDAGVDYLWSDNPGTGSIALDFETVYNKAHLADFWCFKVGYNGNYSINRLAEEYKYYSDFEAFKTGNIIVCNTMESDFYENGILEPHIILTDLISIFYPESIQDHNRKYFQMINLTD